MAKRKRKHHYGAMARRGGTVVRNVYRRGRKAFVGGGFKSTGKIFACTLGLKIANSLLFGIRQADGTIKGGIIPGIAQDDLMMKYAVLWIFGRFMVSKLKIPVDVITVIEVKLSDAVISKFGSSIPSLNFGGIFDGIFDGTESNPAAPVYAGEGDILQDQNGVKFIIRNGQYVPLNGDPEEILYGRDVNDSFEGDETDLNGDQYY